MDVCCCSLADVASLTYAAKLLLADLSWNNVEQVPGQLPLTLVSLNLSHNRLCDLTSTLAELARLPKLRILHLKVSLGQLHLLPALHACRSIINKLQLSDLNMIVTFSFNCLPTACNFTSESRRHSVCQTAVEWLDLIVK